MNVARDRRIEVQPSLAASSSGIRARCSTDGARIAEQGGSPHPQPGKPALRAAFTLMELLVVISIIALVAAFSVPALKNMKRVDADAAATRQLADEIANARQRAISRRSDVYMVFIPPAGNNYFNFNLPVGFQELQQATNLLGFQYSGYGFYSERTVGDQPGLSRPRYLGEWRQLPEGTFIATNKFVVNTPPITLSPFNVVPAVPQFGYRPFPFPDADSRTTRLLPYIAFDYEGKVFHLDANGNKVYGNDEVIPLGRGTVSSPSGRTGPPYIAAAQEKPNWNSISNYTHLRVNWLTGRTSIERQEVR